MKRAWLIWGAAGAVVLLLVIGAAVGGGGRESAPYRTAVVERGELARVVSATGALEPVTTVDVGSTVSGPVLSVEADFNDEVKAGQVLARIDPQTFRARVDQLAASLAQSEANAALAQAEFKRYEALGAQGFASPLLIDQRRAAMESADATVASTRAQLASARVDLERTVIRAPVDGVVVDRQVDPGQSVAASFQAPTLFLIAQNLSQLQALISVDEADIGDVREGQLVRFTVDAFPGEEFSARVSQVRQQGVANQGVVSYTVVVTADNPGGRLKPGMTANAEIVIEEKENALRAPNAALRFKPLDPALQKAAAGLRQGPAEGGAGRAAVLWTLEEDRPTPVRVRLGVSSDSHTEIVGGLSEGQSVIVGGGPQAPARLPGPGGPGGGRAPL